MINESFIRLIGSELLELKKYKLTPKKQGVFIDWVEKFQKGQQLVAERFNTPVLEPCFISGKLNPGSFTWFDPDDLSIYVDIELMPPLIELHAKSETPPHDFVTDSHFRRLKLNLPTKYLPLAAGIEEQAHAVYEQKIKPKMGDRDRSTGLYDGSDTSEEFAFRTKLTLASEGHFPLFGVSYGRYLNSAEIFEKRRQVKISSRV